MYANTESTQKPWVAFDASQAVENWLDGYPNKGFVLRATGNPFEGAGEANYNRYFSGQDSKLEISYRVETNDPTLTILSPQNYHSVAPTTTSIVVSGTASDDTGLSAVAWKNNTTGTSGTASGTTSWSCTVDLAVGSNHIAVTATDVVGNSTSQSLFIIRSEPDTTPPGNVSSCSTTAMPAAIELAWNNPTNSDFSGVVILSSPNPITATLENGSSYSIGSSVGDCDVVYVGSDTPFLHLGLHPLRDYYYRIYAFDQAHNYASGVSLFGVPLPQPDITGDGQVNLLDFSGLSAGWARVDCSGLNNWCDGADLDHSGSVNVDDLRILAEHWVGGASGDPDLALVAPLVATPPAIDGVLSAGEWPSGHAVMMHRLDAGGEHGATVHCQHDGEFLYLGIQSAWGSGWDVYWWFNIDGDHSRSFSGSAALPHIDISYSRQSPGGWSGYTQYRYYTADHPEGILTSAPPGFVAASAGSEDVAYEFRIPLSDIAAEPGDTVGFYLAHGYDGQGEHLYVYPTEQADIESWATLFLAAPTD